MADATFNTKIQHAAGGNQLTVAAGGKIVHEGQTAVTQITSITTGVTCNALSGVITTVSQTVAAGAEADIVVTNSQVAATDVVVACIKTHTSAGAFIAAVSAVATGSFTLRLTNLDAAAAGNNVLVINFFVIKATA
jgi:hypothetical protein